MLAGTCRHDRHHSRSDLRGLQPSQRPRQFPASQPESRVQGSGYSPDGILAANALTGAAGAVPSGQPLIAVWALRAGGVALLVRPVHIAMEFVVAARADGYSFANDTVSALGVVGCTVQHCSPRHALMNAVFIGFGVLLVVGSLLLARSLGPWVAGLLVISGLSSIATGLAPLDRGAALHALAATPLFLAQPAALIALACQWWRSRPASARLLLATGVVTAFAAFAFVLIGDRPGAGALERLALWPVLVALAGVGLLHLRPGRKRGRPYLGAST